jgi:hypothetical protein
VLEEEPLQGSWHAESAGEAPPPFAVNGNLAVPCKVAGLDLLFEADAAQGSGTGLGRLRFTLAQPGRPLLDLVPRPTRVVLDGQELAPGLLRIVTTPDETTPLRMLDTHLDAGVEHELQVEYTLRDSTVQFSDGGVRLGLFMTDIEQRGFLERHAPANLEFDQVPMSAEVRISGVTRPHQLFTNGSAETDGAGTWRVTFPDYFNCSSCYLHLTDRTLSVREAAFAGAEREFRVKAYGERAEDTEQALEVALVVLRELEETYGPYAQESLLIYCTGEADGGMEYAGAAMTSLKALGHELTHSWFARGVMPANGNAGWIDEAVAYWRDLGYPRAASAPARPPVNLAGFSPYRRHTTFDSYEMGSLLLSELDGLLGPEGLRPLLSRLYRERRRQLITTPLFQSFLEEQTETPLGSVFDRYVYGKSVGGEVPPGSESTAGLTEAVLAPPPPRAYTSAQLRALL